MGSGCQVFTEVCRLVLGQTKEHSLALYTNTVIKLGLIM